MAEQNFQAIGRALDQAPAVIEGRGSARFPLSTSLSGSPVPVGKSNTLVHTFPINTNAMEELYLYAYNYSTSDYNLSMSLATGSADAFVVNNIIVPVTKEGGLTLCYPGIPHKSTKPPLRRRLTLEHALKVYVKTKDNAEALSVVGYVIRYYPVDSSGNAASRKYGYSTE
jgi:hypothetical protein